MSGPFGRLFAWARTAWAELSLSRVQSAVAIATGLVTIVGTVYSIRHLERSATGDLVAIVEDAASKAAISDAAVEVLTPEDALVARLTPDALGHVRQSLKEGAYRVRVSHPSYSVESRRVQITPEQTVELRLALRPGSSAPLERAKEAITGGAKAVGRILGSKSN